MIAVSDSFKKAIKSDNREIYGYVDVVYDEKTGDYSVDQIPAIAPISRQDGSDLIDGIKKMKNYATLENNYFLLDGSFILANENTLEDSGGYTSENIFSNINDKTITIVSSETGYVTTAGFTIFFKDNIPFDFDINIVTDYEDEDSNIAINIRNNTEYRYQKIFESEITIKEFTLNILSTEYNDRRIRIADIYFSLADIYEGEELVNFEVNEEIDIMLTSTPINTCTINLNNYPDENGFYKFDPINSTGIVPYLTDNTTIIPYIGVLTDDNGIEYVKMGTFYLTDWSSDNDGNVTLNGSSSLYFLKNEVIVAKETTNRGPCVVLPSNYNFMLYLGSDLQCWYLKKYNLYDFLLNYLMLFRINSTNYNYLIYLYANRDNVITTRYSRPSFVDSISRYNLLEDVNVTTNLPIKEVIIKSYTYYASAYTSDQSRNILNTSYTLTDTVEDVWFPLSGYGNRDSYSRFSYTVISGQASASLITNGFFSIYVRIRGTVGSIINIKYKANPTPYELKDIELKYTSDLNKIGETVTIDTTDYNRNYMSKEFGNYFLNHYYKYSVVVNTTGDPSLEVGDGVEISTRYDTDLNIIITKQKFTYDGGLQCELEGRGN